MISTNTAKTKYNLREDDLQNLRFQSFRNPIYKKGPRMRLYEESDILAAVEKKKARDESKELEKKEKRLERREVKKVKRAERKADAKTLVSAIPSRQSFQLRTGRLILPMEVLYQIMEELVALYEHSGVRGVGLTVKDLVSLAFSCKDLCIAADYGIKKFGELMAEMVPFPKILRLPDPQKLVSDPLSLNLKPLKGTLKMFRKSAQGCKEGIYLFIP